MILAVGYRVRSHRGTQFRRWATELLREYVIKGFVLDDERLKEGRTLGADYFWRAKLDAFLAFNERDLLSDAGRVSAEVAQRLALAAYDRFERRRLAEEASAPD